ncbi:glycosyltransferase family 2 protein [Candidatus Woesebacteria bacterium]|nr:glycosyltransferase family 2 protein [Candidatus Woesebacteria bacterium]
MSLLHNKITLLIPFYNESNRIFNTLKLMTQVKNLHEIICVDDGSQDLNYKKVKKKYPQIRVLRLKKNQGKSSAILHGLISVTTEWVFFLDADLKNLQIAEIEKAVKTILKANAKEKKTDMLILRRSNYSTWVTTIRHDILMSGERIMRTEDALAVFKNPPTGYQLEVAINLYMLNQQKKCYWQQTSLANSYKFTKWSLLESLEKYKDEVSGYMGYAGPINYFKQLAQFCRDEHPEF